MELDLTKAGQYDGPLKIRKVVLPTGNSRFADVWFEGTDVKAYCFGDAKFIDKLVVGAEHPGTLVWQPKEKKPDEMGIRLAAFGPPQPKGGGQRGFTPKSKEEIHAGPVASIIAAAISLDRALDQVGAHIDMGLKKYFEAMGRVGLHTTNDIRHTTGEAERTSQPEARAHGQESASKAARPDPKRGEAMATLERLGFSAAESSKLEEACKKRALDFVGTVLRFYGGGYTSKAALQAKVKEFDIVEVPA